MGAVVKPGPKLCRKCDSQEREGKSRQVYYEKFSPEALPRGGAQVPVPRNMGKNKRDLCRR